MDNQSTLIAQKLMYSFMQFNRLHWNQSPIAGLRHSELVALHCIRKTIKSDTPGIKISELSGILKVSSPTITQLINGLENKGFVQRSADPDDRRAVRIRLTSEGEKVTKKAGETLLASFIGLVEDLGEDSCTELSELLSKVFAYFDRMRNQGFGSPT